MTATCHSHLDPSPRSAEDDIRAAAAQAGKQAALQSPETLITAHEAAKDGTLRALSRLKRALLEEQVPERNENLAHAALIERIIAVSSGAAEAVLEAHQVRNPDWLHAPENPRASNARRAAVQAAKAGFDTALQLLKATAATGTPATSQPRRHAMKTAVMTAERFKKRAAYVARSLP